MVCDGEEDYDGNFALLWETCKDTVPAPFTSKSNKVQVHFKTNGRVQKKGWRLIYAEICYGII